jgi:uncharacterized protein YqgC (DUF456 family)
MKRFLKLLFWVPLAIAILVVIVAEAVANRHYVNIYLDPLAGSSSEGTEITVRLFVVILAAIMLGVLIGSFVTYFEQGRHRRAARTARADAESLRTELARLSRPRPGEKSKV